MYIIWKDEQNENRLLIEVFNEINLLDIQREFIEKGYIIIEVFKTKDVFIRLEKF